MCDIDDGIFGKIDMFEILKLFEKGRKDIESFFLKLVKRYA